MYNKNNIAWRKWRLLKRKRYVISRSPRSSEQRQGFFFIWGRRLILTKFFFIKQILDIWLPLWRKSTAEVKFKTFSSCIA